jgi:hypothetical protein
VSERGEKDSFGTNASCVLRARKRRIPRTTAARTADKNVTRGRAAERRFRRSGRGNL